jgi:hypothetical protein
VDPYSGLILSYRLLPRSLEWFEFTVVLHRLTMLDPVSNIALPYGQVEPTTIISLEGESQDETERR